LGSGRGQRGQREEKHSGETGGPGHGYREEYCFS